MRNLFKVLSCFILFNKKLKQVIGLTTKLSVCYQFGTIYIYYAELFTTRVRGIVLGIVLVFSRSYMGISSYIILLANDLNIHPCVMALIGVAIGLPSAILLPETKYDGIKN